MLWLLPAILALGFGAYQRSVGEKRWAASNAILFYLALIFFIVSQAGRDAFVGNETELLSFFIYGLIALAAGEAAAAFGGKRWVRGLGVFAPLTAASFAFGFDVLRPDEYSYIPAAILFVLVALVAGRVYWSFAVPVKEPPDGLGVSVLAFAVMVFAATYKTMDRGWLLPWAYMASAGALLFAAVHLREAAARLLKRKAPSVWQLALLAQLGVGLMVVAAWFVYREFI